LIFLKLVISPVDFIFNISLKRKMSKKDYNKLRSTLSNLKTELYLLYKDIGSNEALVIPLTKAKWYELASYTIKEDNGNFSKVYLHLNDFITIQEEKYKESYAIVKGIFRHKGNDENNYAFIVVDWFENIGQEHLILKCPIYHLQTKKWRRIFPISVIDNVQKIHFIRYDDKKWIKNNFYFTVI
jgi:hypothetical protein